MDVYLHDIPLDEARARFYTALEKHGLLGVLGSEQIVLDEKAVGRVLFEPVWAKISSPHYHSAAMDGFAVVASNTDDATPTNPIQLKYGEDALYVDTGDPLPKWANAVIPIENVEPLDNDGHPAPQPRQPAFIRIRASVPPWSHVRPMGEDIVATQLVLPAGHVLRPVDLGAIAGCGYQTITVARKPNVGIIPTGTELIAIGEPIEEGKIIEYNSIVLASQVNLWGGNAKRYPITADNFELILERVKSAVEVNDLVLLNAGSSAGSEDFSAQVVETLGDLLVHGIAVRPGHPVIFGMIYREDNKAVPIIGVPGYPVSAALTGEIFVEPLMALWLGRKPKSYPTAKAILTRKVTSPAGDDDYVRVAVGRVGEKILAAPLSRGSGVITSLVRADGLMVIPSGSQGFPAGEEVEVRLYVNLDDLDKTIFAIGSHDITLDLMAQYLANYDRRLVSSNVGSLGGLVALRRGEAHFAGSHLLDPESGEYNLTYIRQYLPNVPVRVIALVERQQGLLVAKGNPKSIYSLEDLAKPGIRFINRQRGAGTRVLLDYHLSQLGINPEKIEGYNQEEYTHLTLAAAIASGRADCGLGIAAAAYALDLDFIPLFSERYDLVIPRQFLDSPLLAPMIELLENQQFKQDILQLPGYNINIMGTVIADIG